MAGVDFRVPGFTQPISSPESYVTGVLRAFDAASQALGAATDRLVLRLARSDDGDPDYQIQTLDGEDIAAFSGSSHDFLFDDISTPIDGDRLSREEFAVEDVKTGSTRSTARAARAGRSARRFAPTGWSAAPTTPATTTERHQSPPEL